MKYPDLKFGSEQDFKRAIIELEWIRGRRKLRREDFQEVSCKYRLPVDFLKKSLQGLDLDDYIIFRSEWFPIMYSWKFEADNTNRNFVKLCVDHVRSRYFSKRFLVYTVALLSYFSFYLVLFLNKTIEDVAFTLIFPVLLFAVEIFIELKARVAERRSKRDEFARQMIFRGFGQNVESTIAFVEKQWKTAVFAPYKLINASTLLFFPLEKLKGKDFQEARKRIPKEFKHYPHFLGEDAHQSYEKRIDNLLGEKSKELFRQPQDIP